MIPFALTVAPLDSALDKNAQYLIYSQRLVLDGKQS